jgi:hypothetical protein
MTSIVPVRRAPEQFGRRADLRLRQLAIVHLDEDRLIPLAESTPGGWQGR